MGLGVLSSPGWLPPPPTPAALASPLPKSWDQSETVARPLCLQLNLQKTVSYLQGWEPGTLYMPSSTAP